MKLPNRLAPHDLSSMPVEDSDDPRYGYAVPWFDRLLARWEVSQFAAVPFSISVFDPVHRNELFPQPVR